MMRVFAATVIHATERFVRSIPETTNVSKTSIFSLKTLNWYDPKLSLNVGNWNVSCCNQSLQSSSGFLNLSWFVAPFQRHSSPMATALQTKKLHMSSERNKAMVSGLLMASQNSPHGLGGHRVPLRNPGQVQRQRFHHEFLLRRKPDCCVCHSFVGKAWNYFSLHRVLVMMTNVNALFPKAQEAILHIPSAKPLLSVSDLILKREVKAAWTDGPVVDHASLLCGSIFVTKHLLMASPFVATVMKVKKFRKYLRQQHTDI